MANIVYFIAFFAIGAGPPLRWGLRIAIASMFQFLFSLILISTPYDPGLSFDVGKLVAFCIGISILAGFALRALIEVLWLGRPNPAGEDKVFLNIFDTALIFAAGSWAGCFAFYQVALASAGGSGGLNLHLQIAALAAAVGVIATALLRRRWSASLLGAGFTIAALALDGGYRYPDLILSQANRVGPDQPRCLMVGATLQAPRTRADLMALTLPKNKIDPSAVVLLVQLERGPYLFRWSFRERSFVTLRRDAKEPLYCTPSLTTLTVD